MRSAVRGRTTSSGCAPRSSRRRAETPAPRSATSTRLAASTRITSGSSCKALKWRTPRAEATVCAPFRACPVVRRSGGAGLSELDIAAGAAAGTSGQDLVADRASAPYGPEPLLRRMLALGDVLAVSAAAVVVGIWGSGPTAALLLVLSAPIWIVAAKFAGL